MDRDRTSIREERLETLRTARIALLGDRRGADLEEIWYLLHGYRQAAARFLTRFSELVAPGRLLVAPEALSRFYVTRGGGEGPPDTVGASWMTREDREWEIRDYVRYLNRVAAHVEAPGGEVHRTVLGFSQGAHTAARWAVLGRIATDRLILWGQGLPRDLPPEAASRLESTRVVVVRGREDPFRRREEERCDEEWLERSGVVHEIHEHPHGHEIVPDVLAALAEG